MKAVWLSSKQSDDEVNMSATFVSLVGVLLLVAVQMNHAQASPAAKERGYHVPASEQMPERDPPPPAALFL
jgi:hypothetical protein